MPFAESGASVPCLYDFQSLECATLVNSGGCTTLYEFLYYLGNLKSATIGLMPDAENLEYFLSDTYNLREVRFLHPITSATTMSDFFLRSPLESVDFPAITGSTSLQELFYNCSALKRVSLPSTPNVENMRRMFFSCGCLEQVTLGDTHSVTDTAYMFIDCTGLKRAPEFDTSNVEDMSSMFYNCTSLVEVPSYDTSSVTSMDSMFNSCSSLRVVPPLDVSGVTDFEGIFSGCVNLQVGRLNGTSATISYNGCNMEREAIVDVFNGLAEANAIIYVQGNPGSLDLTPSDLAIATDKGWTVLS